jgi:hypothetical protein
VTPDFWNSLPTPSSLLSTTPSLDDLSSPTSSLFSAQNLDLNMYREKELEMKGVSPHLISTTPPPTHDPLLIAPNPSFTQPPLWFSEHRRAASALPSREMHDFTFSRNRTQSSFDKGPVSPPLSPKLKRARCISTDTYSDRAFVCPEEGW